MQAVNYPAMRFHRCLAVVAVLLSLAPGLSFASAYNGHPKLVVVIVIDQFRGDYLERYRDQFVDGGFRLLLDHGAYFSNCNYDYANTRTAPGHATLFTGAYSNGHGIHSNEWWDPQKKKLVTSVEDDSTKLLGVASSDPGASPHNLLADTIGDELKLATQGKSRVFALALKDRAAVLPGGFAADGAYWIDQKSGLWVTSTYYRKELPAWVQKFNDSNRTEKYLGRNWTSSDGTLLRSTKPDAGKPVNFYHLVGSTPFANDYEFEFARELVTYEKLGSGPATDLLAISLSANDILGHQVGPDSPEMAAMALAMDKQLAAFFDFLGHEIGLANVWIALSADHGVSPAPPAAASLRIPAANLSPDKLRDEINKILSDKLSRGTQCRLRRRFRLSAGVGEFECVCRHPDERSRCRAGSWGSHEAGGAARLLHPDAAGRGHGPQHRDRAEIRTQLLAAGELVCAGRAGAVQCWRRVGNRSRVPFHLRYPRAAGLLRPSVSAGNLPHPFRTGGSGCDPRFPARHQCADQRDRAGSD